MIPSRQLPSTSTSTPKRSRSISPTRTSLPSIHQLHPYLPHAAHAYHPAHYYAAPSAPSAPSAPPAPDDRKYSDAYSASPVPAASGSNVGDEPTGLADSDPDADAQHDHSGPPKKKRRRQALSCTECKRRKIKCDRSQPCGPCLRRGEQDKCQWHVVEPIEKYVTRAEWDDLQGRFTRLENRYDRLEAFMLHLHPDLVAYLGAVSPSSHLPSPAPSRIPTLLAGPGVTGFRRPSPHPPGPISAVPYPSDPSSLPSALSPRSHHPQPHPSPPVSYQIPKYLPPPPRAPSSSPRPPHDDPHKHPGPRRSRAGPSALRAASSPVLRKSPLALASIVVTDPTPLPSPSPPPPHPHAKNWQAQTLPQPGGRLRPVPPRDPAPPAHRRSTTPPPTPPRGTATAPSTPRASSPTRSCRATSPSPRRPPPLSAAFSPPQVLAIH